MAKARRQWRVMVGVLSALALLFLSFAHQPALARQITPEMATQYALPDGTIGDICFGSDGVEDRNSPHKGLAPVCDYCRLAASIALPLPQDDSYLVLRVAALAENKPDFPLVFVEYPRPMAQSRAPPLPR